MDTTQSGIAQPPDPAAMRKLFFQVFPSIMLPMFLSALDQTIVSTALPAIAGALGNVEQISWVVVAYLLANTIAAPIYGRLGDAIGRKRMLFVALTILMVASVLGALASNIWVLVLARAIQGLGGGGLMTLSQALIGEAVPPRERGRYQGYLATTFVTASTFGPVVGGYLTEHFGWPSVFLVNIPLCLLSMLLAVRLKSQYQGGGRFSFDLWGTLFFTLTVVPGLIALEQVREMDARTLPVIGVLLAIAAAALVMLVRQERRAPTPLLPVNLLRNATILRSDLMALCLAGAVVSMITFLPLYLQVARGVSVGDTGLLMLPLTAGIGIGSIFTGRMIARTGLTAVWPSFGLIVSVVMLLFMAIMAPYLPVTALPWVFALISMSFGTGMPVVQITVQTIAGPKSLAAAAASVQISRSVGAAFATAVVGTVLFAILAAKDKQTAAMFTELVQSGPHVLATLDQVRREAVQSEIADAFRGAFLTVAGFAGAALLLAWSIPVRRL
jgi:EmrB/QacA subfamily drug resistance transporter